MKISQKGFFRIPIFLAVALIIIAAGLFYLFIKSNNPVISAIMPEEAARGEKVSIVGTGFTATDNEILFAQTNGKYSGEGIVILNKDNSTVTASPDGITLTFEVPSLGFKKIICPGPEACLPFPPTFDPGEYKVYVKNAKGTSNKVIFTIK